MAYRIRELREKKKLTQEQLAQMSGVSRTTIQIFEERNEKDCCLNCKKLIVKQTDAGHINFCGETGKIILDMFLDVGTHFPKCKYERKE